MLIDNPVAPSINTEALQRAIVVAEYFARAVQRLGTIRFDQAGRCQAGCCHAQIVSEDAHQFSADFSRLTGPFASSIQDKPRIHHRYWLSCATVGWLAVILRCGSK
jgi:hypothetical protein